MAVELSRVNGLEAIKAWESSPEGQELTKELQEINSELDRRILSYQEPLISHNFTDLGNSQRMVEMYRGKIKYCYGWKKWLYWNTKHWQIDDQGYIPRMGKQVVLSLYGEASKEKDDNKRKEIIKHARSSESERKIEAMIKLTESEMSVLEAELDQNKYLLNCLNGTVDLKTGKLKWHEKDDLITKIIPCEYNPGTYPHKWEKFLLEIMDKKVELIQFLQRAIGYSLTGDTSEQCLFFLHGSGANGKSTFLSVIQTLLNDYAKKADFETFLYRKDYAIRNDIARLAGAVRFVSAIETGRGKILNEIVVKELTGGDIVTARKLYQEYKEFKPQFKLWWGANSKPIIREQSHAIWRRIRLIPFNVVIPEAEQNKNLYNELIEELPAILNWAVLGCIKWQEQGLNPPAEVIEATSGYKTEMDRIGPFMEDCCNLEDGLKIEKSEIYKEYEEWCSNNGEEPISKMAFTLSLREKGINDLRLSSKRLWKGLGLKEKE